MKQAYQMHGLAGDPDLLKDGWGWWYRKYAPLDTGLEQLEKTARGAKYSLWADPAPVPLWIYRKARRPHFLPTPP